MSQTENDAQKENKEEKNTQFRAKHQSIENFLQRLFLTMMAIKDHFDPFN